MENQERIENQETERPQEETITITKADYAKAIKDEIHAVMTNPEFSGITGPLTIVTAGSAFAMAVWGRLTGEHD